MTNTAHDVVIFSIEMAGCILLLLN